ncbi:hypothetical protein TNCV_1600721 [Trichonephila clavipes]|nr:hypothetical protein TNCV_1600721 [Trichonephila clavipes]
MTSIEQPHYISTHDDKRDVYVAMMNLSAASNSDEDIRLNENDCKEFEESAAVIDNIPANSDIYVTRDGTEGIPHNINVLGRFLP